MKKFTSPIERMDKYLTRKGLITAERTAKVRLEAKNAVRDALKNATGELLPEIDNLFSDVYEKIPLHLLEQREELREHIKKYPDSYELEKFENGKSFLKWLFNYQTISASCNSWLLLHLCIGTTVISSQACLLWF